MRNDLAGLRALLCVAEHKSFTAAAADLGISPSAVSQAVRALEDRVGVRLLARTTRTVGLTEAGALFVARVSPAMSQIDEAVESLGELRGRPSGLLRLTMLRSGYADVIRPILARFLAAHPDIRVELSLDETLSNIVADGFDAGLRLGHTLDREMIAVRVSSAQRLVVVGSPRYFAAGGKPAHPSELHTHDCIRLRNPTRGNVDRWRFIDAGNELEIAVEGRVITNDGASLVDAAVDGLGLAYVFDSMVARYVARRQLVRVLDRFCPEFPGYYLYYPSRANLAPKLKALVEFLKRGGARR